MRKATKWLFVGLLVVLLALPLVGASAQGIGGPYTVGFQVQNLSGSATANIAIQFYNQSGAVVATVSDTIAANANKTYFPLSAVPSGFNGSVVVSSDQPVASIANVIFPDGTGGAAYSSFSSGATTVNMPLIMKNNYGLDTWFNVQNTSGSATTVNVSYAPGGCTESQTVPAFSSKTFDQSTNSCLPNGFVGGATITAGQPVVAVGMQIQRGGKSLLAYNGFTNSSTSLVFPQISSNYYNSGTSLNIQNAGGSTTNVTITYTPSAGFPGATCTETKAIAPGATTVFGFPQLPAACGTGGSGVTDAGNGGFVGAAKVTSNSANMPLVGIVNQITRGTANAAAYNAVNPANATNKVSMPLIMDRNYGIFTGFSVANVGNSTTNVSCTFSGAGAPAAISSTAVAPGASLTAVQLNQASTAPYVGAAICTASGGDAKIAAIVNELTQGAAATTDALEDYDAFNY